MTGVLVSSTDSYAGKSLMCIILGLKLQQEGRSVGYFKPIGFLPARVEGVMVDEDAVFIREVLGLREKLADLSPVIADADLYRRAMKEDLAPQLGTRIHEAYARAAQGHEVMLVGGVGGAAVTGKALGLEARRLADLLECQVLLVGKYESERSVDGVLLAREALGERLVGMVLNDVGANHLSFVCEQVTPFLKQAGIKVFGALPHDPVLRSISVGELADHLGADMLCCEDRREELVEHFMVGAMNVESALRYFRRMPNKAVITGGDRSDVQLAALETASKCVVLTGGLRPSSPVITRSQELHIPLLLSRDDTLTVVAKVERLLGRVRVREKAKITRAVELAQEHLDFAAMWAALGL